MTSIADDKRRSKTYSPRIKESSLEALSLLTINMMRAFVLFAVLASVAAHDLTPDNFDELTNGKSVFIKFLAPVSASLFCFINANIDCDGRWGVRGGCRVASRGAKSFRENRRRHHAAGHCLTCLAPVSVVRTLQIHEACLGPAHGRIQGNQFPDGP
jgi:hypothetical protein